MSFNNIVVTGVARNCGKYIEAAIKSIQNSLVNSKNVRYLIIESDSEDNTLEKLKELKNTIHNFEYISLGKLVQQIPLRTERLAHCRNRYLEELENNHLYADSEYVLISDLDTCNELLNAENLKSCLEIKDWDVCTANQCGIYYDIWALRHPMLSPNDCWEVSRYMEKQLGINPKHAKKKALKSRLFWFPKSLKPFEVHSAFGGLALYKRDVINNARYIGVDEYGSEVCEHVAFHKQIREKGGKIYLNPKLLNCYPPTQYVKSRVKKILVRLNRNVYSRFKN
jgi:hypothetical protein